MLEPGLLPNTYELRARSARFGEHLKRGEFFVRGFVSLRYHPPNSKTIDDCTKHTQCARQPTGVDEKNDSENAKYHNRRTKNEQ